MTENMVFAFPNFADADYYAPVLSGGDWEAALPLANLQDRLLSLVARSADAERASTRFHLDMKAIRDVRLFSVHNYNLGRSARVRFRAAQQAAFSGVVLAAAADEGDDTISVARPGGRAMLRAGDTFVLNGTVHTVTGDGAGVGGNLIPYSEDFTSDTWDAGPSATVTADAGEAPDGTQTASFWQEDTSEDNRRLNCDLDYLGLAGVAVTTSLFEEEAGRVLAIEHDWFFGGLAVVAFDLAAGAAVVTQQDDTVVIVDSGVADIGDGRYRVWLTTRCTDATQVLRAANLYMRPDAATEIYTGDGTSGLYLWGWQVEAGRLGAYVRSGDTPAAELTTGDIEVTPAVSADVPAGTALTALCGDFLSAAPSLDSGWLEPWPVIYEWYLPWESPSFWDGRGTEEERQGYPKNFHYLHPGAALARYALVEFDDADNPDGFVQLGRVFVARALQPSKNFTYDTELGWQDDSGVKQTLGGAEFYDERAPYRTLAGKIEHLPKDEALQDFYEMHRKLGKTKQVYVILDPAETTHRHRLGMLATFRDLQRMPVTSYGRYTTFFNLKEVIA